MAALKEAKIKGRGMTVAGSGGRIGVVLMFAVGSCEVPVKDVERWVKGQKVLERKDLPSEPTDVDAFMCACSQDNVDIWRTLSDMKLEVLEKLPGERLGTTYVTLPLKSKKGEYVLERRVWMKKDEVIAPQHPNVARLYYDKDNDSVGVEMYEGFKDYEVQGAIEDILGKEFKRQRSFINGTRHRQAIYKLVESVGGIHFLGGMSAWFVPVAGERKVEAFQDYLNDVAAQYKTTYYPTEMRVLPVVDTERMREDIARDVAREVQTRYEKLLDETMEYVQGLEGKSRINESKMEEALLSRLAQVERMQGLREEYERLLERKINIERKKMDTIVSTTGRARDILIRIQEVLK